MVKKPFITFTTLSKVEFVRKPIYSHQNRQNSDPKARKTQHYFLEGKEIDIFFCRNAYFRAERKIEVLTKFCEKYTHSDQNLGGEMPLPPKSARGGTWPARSVCPPA